MLNERPAVPAALQETCMPVSGLQFVLFAIAFVGVGVTAALADPRGV